mmetsp:Transcript_11428/g.32372  ORF Transcript_11428/g.32372 Transcript_11428/m.32372 type:complete len:222 (-) Transcript_11428:77-742(-)
MPGLVLPGAVHHVVPVVVFGLPAIRVGIGRRLLLLLLLPTSDSVEQRRNFPPGPPRPLIPLLHLLAPQFPRPLLLLLGVGQGPAVRRGGEVPRLLLGGPVAVQAEDSRPSGEYLCGGVGARPVHSHFVLGAGTVAATSICDVRGRTRVCCCCCRRICACGSEPSAAGGAAAAALQGSTRRNEETVGAAAAAAAGAAAADTGRRGEGMASAAARQRQHDDHG